MRFYLINLFFLTMTYLLSPFFYFKIFARKFGLKKKKYNVLVFQTQRIGDMVCTTPVFKEIKKRYPDSSITVLGPLPALEMLAGNSHIDEFIKYDPFSLVSFLKTWLVLFFKPFTHSLTFFPSLSSSMLPFWLGVPERICTKTTASRISTKLLSVFVNRSVVYKQGEYAPKHHLALLKVMGINNPDSKREVFATEIANKKIKSYFKSLGIESSDKIVGISVNCAKKFREYPKEKFVQFIDRLKEDHDVTILFIGAPSEKGDIDSVIEKVADNSKMFNLAGVFRLSDLAALFKALDVFISVDTGLLYMADAAGTPVIDIIGPSDPDTQGPQGEKSVILRADKSIKSCSYIMYAPDCEKDQLKMLMDISPKRILKAYNSIMK